MRRRAQEWAWAWLESGRLRIVVTTPQRQWQHGRNAFELGRDYERYEQREAIK